MLKGPILALLNLPISPANTLYVGVEPVAPGPLHPSGSHRDTTLHPGGSRPHPGALTQIL